MRYIFVAMVVIHGFIHLLGFIKAFDISDIKELTLPISKPMGIFWLITGITFLAYGGVYLSGSRYAWLLGFVAVVFSQVLVILFWQDAKFGTIPNVLILLISVLAYGQFNFQNLIERETQVIIRGVSGSSGAIVSPDDLQELPDPVARWLQRSGAVGKPYIFGGKVLQKAAMKLKPEQDYWLQARAVQFTNIEVPAFIWTVDLKMNRLIRMRGRDKFENGKGEMLIKLNSLFNVVNESGPKLDEGTIQRYLGEMVWFPSLALSPYVSWTAIDAHSAKATMEYQGAKGSGTFYFTDEGDFISFSAMRYKGNEPEAKKYEWVLSVDGYESFEGIRVPAKMTATWKLENADWTWLQLEIDDIAYNENATK
nr:hypothetical protein [Cytophagales bacterium]